MSNKLPAPLATSSTTSPCTTRHGAGAACTTRCAPPTSTPPQRSTTPHQGTALSSKTLLDAISLGPDDFLVGLGGGLVCVPIYQPKTPTKNTLPHRPQYPARKRQHQPRNTHPFLHLNTALYQPPRLPAPMHIIQQGPAIRMLLRAPLWILCCLGTSPDQSRRPDSDGPVRLRQLQQTVAMSRVRAVLAQGYGQRCWLK